MKILWGSNRLVVLIGPWAIKIARFRFLRGLCRLVKYQQSKKVRQKIAAYHRNPIVGAIRYISYGILSNLNERRLWKGTGHRFLVPTLYSFVGLVNIQYRGEEITEEEFFASNPFVELLADWSESELLSELMAVKHFCRYNGRVSLFDYGSGEIEDLYVLLESRYSTNEQPGPSFVV